MITKAIVLLTSFLLTSIVSFKKIFIGQFEFAVKTYFRYDKN